MSLRSRLRDLSDESQTAVLDLFDRWQAGGLTEAQFTAAVAAVIARANGRAIRTADRAAAIQLSRLFRRQVRPSADELPDMRSRISDGVTTLLAERPQIATTAALLAVSQRQRLARLARNEPLQRGQEKVQEMFGRHDAGWTRAVGGDACPLCQRWDDGEVRPASIPMPRHTGCSCVQVPARL